ncbi:MAG TPA: hypothetical protein DF613_14735, partial [Lachnospiraceae bacterium]|nr:hypothetical protein [Lachnospiraceae bacterium]
VETKQVYNVYTQELERVFRQTFKMDFFDEKLKSFIRKNKHIVIFGAGDYAGRLTIQLASNNIYFDGYLVSDLKCGKRKFMNKQVWDWNNMPFSPGEVGIVVAIRPVIWNQLIEILRENKIRQYICPFLFEIDDDFARR